MWRDFLSNNILWVTILGWFIAQMIKIVINIIKERKFDFFWIISTGGMPSSHASGVSSLAAAIGLKEGFGSTIFALASIFAFIVMFDAQTSRRSIGRQARILNNMLDDIYAGRRIPEERIKEFMGHTPVEVFIGALLGIAIAVIFCPA